MTSLTVHAECRKAWKQRGNRTGHCSGCHQTFEGLTLFDLHRRGGVCADPQQMVVAGKPLIFDATHGDGTWRSDTSELKAAYERLERAEGTPGAGDTPEAANRQNVSQPEAHQSVVATPHDTLLPDVEGRVHGIKSDSPWTVQCDDCLTCFSGEHLILLVRTVEFNTRDDSGLRLCSPCWEARGWVDGYTGWERR